MKLREELPELKKLRAVAQKIQLQAEALTLKLQLAAEEPKAKDRY